MEKVTLVFLGFFPDIYDFFNLMACQIFFRNEIRMKVSRLIESSEHLFLVIMRFILEKPLSTTASEEGIMI